MKKIEGLGDIINEQLREIDIKSLVEQEIRNAINSEIRQELLRAVRTKTEKIIDTEIEICLEEPINTDDGWGKKASYSSFKELFKTVFSEKLNGNWEMKNMIERHIKERVNKLVSENQIAITKKIADELLK